MQDTFTAEAIPGATVTVSGPVQSSSGTTDALGNVTLEARAGPQVISAGAPGYKSTEVRVTLPLFQICTYLAGLSLEPV